MKYFNFCSDSVKKYVARIRIWIQGPSGSGSGLRFLAGSGSGFNEDGSETLVQSLGADSGSVRVSSLLSKKFPYLFQFC